MKSRLIAKQTGMLKIIKNRQCKILKPGLLIFKLFSNPTFLKFWECLYVHLDHNTGGKLEGCRNLPPFGEHNKKGLQFKK